MIEIITENAQIAKRFQAFYIVLIMKLRKNYVKNVTKSAEKKMLSENKLFTEANKISLQEEAQREELRMLIEINQLKAKLLVDAKMDYSTQTVYSKNGTKLGKFCEFYSK